MFGGKTKEMQQAIEERDEELKKLRSTLKQCETELSSMRIQLDSFQKDREAVLSALTEAQETARRIIAQAEVRSEDMVRKAEEKHRAICEQRDGIIADAESRAQGIIEQAEASARESAERAAAKVSEAEENARRFRDYVKSTADNIKKQAEEYAEFLSGAAYSVEEHKVEVPESYKNPAELMRAIFALQGRDIPDSGEREVETEKHEPEEAVHETPAAVEPVDTNLVEEYDVPTDGEKEDKLWTVDEVMQEGEQKQNSIDADLNAILGDVLKLD